jgi:hypothetical protein
MSKAIQRRLAALERKLKPSMPDLVEILVSGGLPDSDLMSAKANRIRAEFNGHTFLSEPDEPFEVFRARARAAAKAEEAPFVVYGGLPTPDDLIG